MRPPAGAPKAHTRGHSYASSTISRTGSTTSRSSNTNFSSTIGYGGRPASSLSRPQSSIGLRRPNAASVPRPATSLDTHSEDGGSILGKRKGMLPLSLCLNRPSCPPGPSPILPPSGALDQVSRQPSIPVFEDQFLEISQGISCLSIENSQRAPFARSSSSLDPKPPLPWRSQSMSAAPMSTPSKPTRTTSASPKKTPRKTPATTFLTKDSSLTTFDNSLDAEWDQESREKRLEEMFTTVVSRMNQQGQDSFGLKETIEIYKNRGKSKPRLSMITLPLSMIQSSISKNPGTG